MPSSIDVVPAAPYVVALACIGGALGKLDGLARELDRARREHGAALAIERSDAARTPLRSNLERECDIMRHGDRSEINGVSHAHATFSFVLIVLGATR